MGTIFIAGVYGVGKSTLVQKLASRINTPCFSSSTIISAVNGEQYGRNKAVKDKYKNQEILVARVSELLKELEQIIQKLETGDVKFDDATNLFERGAVLCEELLKSFNEAKGKITVIRERLEGLQEEEL